MKKLVLLMDSSVFLDNKRVVLVLTGSEVWLLKSSSYVVEILISWTAAVKLTEIDDTAVLGGVGLVRFVSFPAEMMDENVIRGMRKKSSFSMVQSK